MNRHPLRAMLAFVCSPRGAKITVAAWLLLAALLSVAAPSSKEVAVSAGEGNAFKVSPSAAAQAVLDRQFPSAEGMPLLLVFHDAHGLGHDGMNRIASFAGWLGSDEKPAEVRSAVPFDRMSEAQRGEMLSADGRTLLLQASLQDGLESDRVRDAVDDIQGRWQQQNPNGPQLAMTGPAAIASDTLKLFSNADVVLMLATVALILVLLVAIYRSPLLAVIPLAAAGLAYSVTDRLIGWAGQAGWFVVDKQSLSIMMILLFAVLTDYSLFIFSRYRGELASGGSQYEAMARAMAKVAEPVLFSGGTVLIAMAALFLAAFKPYHGFAPSFTIAVAVILLAGLTLLPAVFALVGRKAFWPFAPKASSPDANGSPAGEPTARQPFWSRVGGLATRRPGVVAGVLLALLLLASLNVSFVNYSFNLMKSFPADTASRQGFELLEKSYPPGQLAPVTIVYRHDGDAASDPKVLAGLKTLTAEWKKDSAVAAVIPDVTEAAALPKSIVSADGHAIRLELMLGVNPYDRQALDKLDEWRSGSAALLAASGLDPSRDELMFAGQTAEQADVRSLNERDTIVAFSVIALCIVLMLAWQARSVRLALAMFFTILLSYAAALGLSWAVFHWGLGYEAISYRIPMYTFVFMVALGIDYNIMLVSRIREEAGSHAWKEAVRRGVGATGGVISSAGLILAATFGVLMTQPMQELFLFGFAMAVGILIDTFIVRGMLLPAILTLLAARNRTSHATVGGDLR